MREFGLGLNTIQGPWSLLSLAVLSVGIWYVTALAYQEVTHSYGVAALEIPVSQLLILMGASMAGSMLQLPAVGGGSQMATIATLSSVFDVPPEMAASCGILLWLVTFAAVVPGWIGAGAAREIIASEVVGREPSRGRLAARASASLDFFPVSITMVRCVAARSVRLLQFPHSTKDINPAFNLIRAALFR